MDKFFISLVFYVIFKSISRIQGLTSLWWEETGQCCDDDLGVFWSIRFCFCRLPLSSSTIITILLFSESNQLEDPRLEWKRQQEAMLKDYMVTAQDDLEVRYLFVFRPSLSSSSLFGKKFI